MFRKEKKEKKGIIRIGFNRALKEIKKEKRIFIILSFLVVFGNIAYSSLKYFLGKIIDFFVNNEVVSFLGTEFNGGYFFLSIFSIIAILDVLASSFRFFYLEPRLGFRVYKSYFLEIFSKISTYPISFFKNVGMGKITYTATKSSSALEFAVPQFFNIIGLIIEISASLFFIFLISPKVFLFLFSILFLYLLVFLTTRNKISQLVDKYNEKRKTTSEKLIEKINFIIEVKKNNKEKYEQTESNKNIRSEEKLFYKKNIYNLKIDLMRGLLYIITTLGTLFLSLYLFKEGEITIGEVTSINLFAMFLVWNYSWIMKVAETLVRDFTVIGDAEKLLSHAPENYSKKKISGEIEGGIEYKNLGFEYEVEPKNPESLGGDFSAEEKQEKKEKKKFSLKNLNLKIEKGQKVAFVGESGSGKSTAVELIGGFYFPSEGETLIDNISTKNWNLNSLRSSIAYVSQDIAIFNSTIGENISYGATKEVSQKEIAEAAKLANISEFIENLPDGYQTKVGEKGLKLSGGQKQRIAIARAILRNPKILILDEPTSALDIASEKYITESLKTLMRNRTTIIIAHRLSTVRDADKIFVFKNGQVVEQGNYQELISKKGEFKKMVDLHEELK